VRCGEGWWDGDDMDVHFRKQNTRFSEFQTSAQVARIVDMKSERRSWDVGVWMFRLYCIILYCRKNMITRGASVVWKTFISLPTAR